MGWSRLKFELCREGFKRHLGYAPRSIAYPWHLGSTPSLQLARRSGFRLAFGVVMDYRAEGGIAPDCPYRRTAGSNPIGCNFCLENNAPAF